MLAPSRIDRAMPTPSGNMKATTMACVATVWTESSVTPSVPMASEMISQ